MANDDRDILDLFYDELDFIEAGGYGRRVKTPWKQTSMFRESLTCLNYAYLSRVHPCSECHLFDSVPAEARNAVVPCHHIPLNKTGETIEELEAQGNQQKLENSVKDWLRAKIKELEEAKASGQEIPKEFSLPADWMRGCEYNSFDLSCLSRRAS